jgi:hypothetical protein
MKSLARLGYREERIAAKADIIITHSAGCFFLPNTDANKLIILIGPPYWPGKPLLLSLVQKLWGDFATSVRRRKVGFWAHKIAWNWIYIFANLLRVVRIAIGARRQKFHEALRGKNVAIIRNDDDSWLAPDVAERLPDGENFAFYHLPGEHEDCWVYPADHAKLIDDIIRESSLVPGDIHV